jgi:hypothetical protein
MSDEFWNPHPIDLSNAPVYDPATFPTMELTDQEFADLMAALDDLRANDCGQDE